VGAEWWWDCEGRREGAAAEGFVNIHIIVGSWCGWGVFNGAPSEVGKDGDWRAGDAAVKDAAPVALSCLADGETFSTGMPVDPRMQGSSLHRRRKEQLPGPSRLRVRATRARQSVGDVHV
jgi:hypothetical protein